MMLVKMRRSCSRWPCLVSGGVIATTNAWHRVVGGCPAATGTATSTQAATAVLYLGRIPGTVGSTRGRLAACLAGDHRLQLTCLRRSLFFGSGIL
eukprot:scaffold451_cov365-Prasinococcus_capsulatus_cf.AAC.13